MTKSEIIDFKGSSEDLEQDSDDYFAVLAYESHGLAIRDNSSRMGYDRQAIRIVFRRIWVIYDTR